MEQLQKQLAKELENSKVNCHLPIDMLKICVCLFVMPIVTHHRTLWTRHFREPTQLHPSLVKYWPVCTRSFNVMTWNQARCCIAGARTLLSVPCPATLHSTH